jgi:hypothetical protein
MAALAKLLRNDEQLVITPQNIYEFWAVATRRPGTLASGGQNGLGMTVERATLWLNRFQNFCRVLPEVPDVLMFWQHLVTSHRVKGFRAHDLRLVAAMQVYHITHVLTFNVSHFNGYGVNVVDPRAV